MTHLEFSLRFGNRARVISGQFGMSALQPGVGYGAEVACWEA